MKNKAMEARLNQEVLEFLHARLSLQLASTGEDGTPYASYAPFAIGENCLYVLLSEIAVHGINLQRHPAASVLVIEDEDTASELFARRRINYRVRAEALAYESRAWQQGIEALVDRHGERPRKLAALSDFCLFQLRPQGGRYVKDFGKAFDLAGGSLGAAAIRHLREGHRPRSVA